MVGERVARVQCYTCGGVHNYYGEKEAKPAVAGAAVRKKEPAARTARKEPGSADREEWESLRPGMEEGRAIPYDMNGKFRVNDLVEHSLFGRGVVKRLAGPGKIEVLFQGGKKLLRCG